MNASVMPEHVAADLLRVGACGWHFVDHLTVMHHHDAIGEFQDFIEIF